MTATYPHLVPPLEDVFNTLSDEMAMVHEWIKANKLLIHFDKSNFMIMSLKIYIHVHVYMSMVMK